ncbi:MAG: tRNA threonylcarbamoyladenosine biosynthesis protein TsaE, partial [Myxococcota bacterium]
MIGETWEHQSKSARTTARIAERLAAQLGAGDVVALIGDLGAGKTCFVRGLARGLGIPPDVPVTSPTFTVVNAYTSGRLPLYHFDLYRLQDVDELEGIGYRDFVGG